MNRKTSNHELAPVCAEFVKAMREAFGDVQVLYVEENGFKLGEPSENIHDRAA